MTIEDDTFALYQQQVVDAALLKNNNEPVCLTTIETSYNQELSIADAIELVLLDSYTDPHND